jgi:hypothetical protein
MAKRNPFAGGVRSRGFGLTLFSDEDMEAIHLATLEVLERTGVFVEADEALDIFADGGCSVDRERHNVTIPPHIVEEAIASAPPRVTLCGRDQRNDVVLEPGRLRPRRFKTTDKTATTARLVAITSIILFMVLWFLRWNAVSRSGRWGRCPRVQCPCRCRSSRIIRAPFSAIR